MCTRTETPVQASGFQHFQQPRAAFFLAVRMDMVLTLRMVLSLDLYLGWYGLCLCLKLYLYLYLYLVYVRIQTYAIE